MRSSSLLGLGSLLHVAMGRICSDTHASASASAYYYDVIICMSDRELEER